jgi:hypothetical protein
MATTLQRPAPISAPTSAPAPAPDWTVSAWLNAPAPIALPQLRGKVTMMVAFQMLCPGCVTVGLPQAQRVRQAFSPDDVAVLGLHTVFEHHEAQGSQAALAAFLHEYRIGFPVGIDASTPDGIPTTMRRYGMRGTPTTLLFARDGSLALHRFGHLDDLELGAAIAGLLQEAPPVSETGVCAIDGGCT